MNANRTAAAVALLGGVLLLSGCAPTPAPTGTPTPTLTSPTTMTPSPTPTQTPSPDSTEAKITATIIGYNDFVNRAFTDPSVPPSEAGRYVADIAPDYLFVAVQQQINAFRAKGYKQTGTAPIVVTSIAPAPDGAYRASICTDASQVRVTDANGQPLNPGPTRSSAEYTLVQGKDGVWRISKIQGTGTAC